MPRRSAADLSIVPLLPGKGRPEPPKALDHVAVRTWGGSLAAVEHRGQEERWAGLVNNLRRPGPSPRPTSSHSSRRYALSRRASLSASRSGCRTGRKTFCARFTTTKLGPGAPSSAWAARTPRRPCPPVCCWRIYAVRRRGTGRTRSSTPPRRAAIRRHHLLLGGKMVRLNPILAPAVRIQETAKMLACPELGTRYRALSAEATTAFGLSPALIVHDELGRVRGPRSPLYEALETAVGAQEAPLSIIISTQAATDADLLSVLIDDALRGADPSTIVRLYTSPPELDPFSGGGDPGRQSCPRQLHEPETKFWRWRRMRRACRRGKMNIGTSS